MEHIPIPVLITPFVELELLNAMQLQVFRKEARRAEIRAAYAAFRKDVEAGVFAIEPLPDRMFTEARRLSSRWTARLGVRSLDIVHVASAIVLRASRFHTFDERQRKLAKAAGLEVAA